MALQLHSPYPVHGEHGKEHLGEKLAWNQVLEYVQRRDSSKRWGTPRLPVEVLFVSHTYIVPTSQQKLDQLAQEGVTVGLIAPSTWRPLDRQFVGQEFRLGQGFERVSVLGVKPIRSGHIASYILSPLPFPRAVRGVDPDVIRVEQEVYSLVAGEVAIVSGRLHKRLVVFGWENLDRRIHPLQRLSRPLVLSAADAIICGNNDAARLARLWAFKGVVEVIPQLGVDLEAFHPSARKREGRVRIGFLGRLVPEKGVNAFLRALRVLVAEKIQFDALIGGSGPAKVEYQSLADELNLHGRLEWREAVGHTDVPGILSTLDVLVLPSRATPKWKEQCGLILAQAMASGVATVGSDPGATPEVIVRDEVLFPSDDYLLLARVLRDIAGSQNLRDELAVYGASRARLIFSSEAMAERTIAAYRSLGLPDQEMHRTGPVSIADLRDPRRTSIFAGMVKFSGLLMTRLAAAWPDVPWPRDALHEWSRQYEYPFAFHHIWRACRPAPNVRDAGSGLTFFPFKTRLNDLDVTYVDADGRMSASFKNLSGTLPDFNRTGMHWIAAVNKHGTSR